MEIKPIRSDKDYSRALHRVEALWGAVAGTPQADELEVLVTLIEAYERERYPIDLPGPLDAIRFRLEQTGVDLKALVGIIGQRTRVYEVMRGDRPLSLTMIRNLNRELGIPADVLIQPTRVRRVGRRQKRPLPGSVHSQSATRATMRNNAELKQLSGRGHSRGWRFNRDEIHER
jgi:HTH-type transcriptional regulator / antitoxin HigA